MRRRRQDGMTVMHQNCFIDAYLVYKKESQNIRFLTTEQICFLVYTKIPNFLCFCISLYISLFLSVSPPLLLYIAFLPVNVWHSAFHFPNEKKISLILHGILHLLSQHLLHQVCFYIFGLSSVYPELCSLYYVLGCAIFVHFY